MINDKGMPTQRGQGAGTFFPHRTTADCQLRTIQEKTGWHQMRTETTVVRVGPPTNALGMKKAASTMLPNEQLIGVTAVGRAASMGMRAPSARRCFSHFFNGKAWSIEYFEDHPNRQHGNEQFKPTYEVVPREDVTVSAGTFHALKIEGDGERKANLAPACRPWRGQCASIDDCDANGMDTSNDRRWRRTNLQCLLVRCQPERNGGKSVEEYDISNCIRSERFASEPPGFQVTN